MLVRCPDCTTQYEIAATLVPENGVKVRCPKCKAVFPVSKISPTNGKSLKPPVPPRFKTGAAEDPRPTVHLESPAPKVATAPPQQELASLPAKPKKKIIDPRVAERLARAVLQEVLYAQTQKRKDALEAGVPLKEFGAPVAEAFEAYQERVAEELPGTTAIFRAAVNDILGEGRTLL